VIILAFVYIRFIRKPPKPMYGPIWHGANVRLNTFTEGSEGYYPEAFNQLEKLGVNVVRLTGASKRGGFQLGKPFEPEMLENFLKEADKRGIKTIFLLSDMFGGKKGIEIAGVKTVREWISEIVTLHVGDERILMWDIWNEPDISDEIVYNYLKEFSSLVKKLDPTHPITIGSWRYGGVWHRPQDGALIVDLVDYYSPHVYIPREEAPEDIFNWTDQQIYDWAFNWHKNRIEEHKKHSKQRPMIIQEFGVNYDGIVEVFGLERAEELEVIYYDAILKSIQDSNISGSIFWVFRPFSPPDPYSPIKPDLTWRKAAYIIQNYYASWGKK
jgi:endo-1,4-beta-mannosidase